MLKLLSGLFIVKTQHIIYYISFRLRVRLAVLENQLRILQIIHIYKYIFKHFQLLKHTRGVQFNLLHFSFCYKMKTIKLTDILF